VFYKSYAKLKLHIALDTDHPLRPKLIAPCDCT
jgi:hypothetical protein